MKPLLSPLTSLLYFYFLGHPFLEPRRRQTNILMSEIRGGNVVDFVGGKKEVANALFL